MENGFSVFDEFKELMTQAVINAKKEFRIHYVYVGSDGEGFETSKYMGENWWFKVYPGGRKIFSEEGAKRMYE